MLSGKLVHLIEVHSGSIIDRVIERMRRDVQLLHLSMVPDAELREWGDMILRRLGHWLATRNEEELAHHYEMNGRARFAEGLPLQEAVHGLFLMKEKVIDFIQEQAFAKTSVQLYAEGEFEHHVGKFFDILVWSLVRGYEDAMHEASAVGVGVGRSRR
jgi:hypothetical protein